MKFIAFFVLFVVAASQAIQFNTELNEHWENFKKAFGKNYNASEEISRRSIWEEKVKYITRHNLRHDLGLHSYRIGLNEHSDMEHEEFLRTFIGQRPLTRHDKHGRIWYPPADVQVPDHVDWREKGLVTPIKNQGHCSSCWTFSATGALEGMHAKKTGRLVSLSEQMLLDCAGYHGCKYGYPQDAFDWIIHNGGIDTEESYPYKAKQHRCKFNSNSVGAKVRDYFNLTRGDEDILKKAVALVGPISINIDASSESFASYKEGIYDNPDCTNVVDHAVLLVGYGTENGKDYWLVKNSWGTSYGDKGYWKMSRNKNNQCNIANDSSFPVA